MATEQRSEPRISTHMKFFVHIHECAEDHDMVGTSITCEALDFSIHGVVSHFPSLTILHIIPR